MVVGDQPSIAVTSTSASASRWARTAAVKRTLRSVPTLILLMPVVTDLRRSEPDTRRVSAAQGEPGRRHGAVR